MTYINKQKFLAELGKLLTFMYEEDRQSALAMYTRMFEDAEDEQALIQALISPTRQAVVVARAYNAKERKLQVHSQSKEDEGIEEGPDEIPEFILAIMDIYHSAVPDKKEENEVPADQLSLFDDDQNPVETEDEAGAETEPEPVPEEEASTKAAPAEKAPEKAAPAEETETEAPQETPAEESEGEKAPAEAETAPEEPAEKAEPEDVQPTEETHGDAADPEEKQGDKVDEFMAHFSIDEEEPAPESQPAKEGFVLPIPDGDEGKNDSDRVKKTATREDGGEGLPAVREPKVLLLILYIVLAIPITAVGVLLLLIPTLLFLALAVAVGGAGSVLLIVAFSGFTVFANTMVVIGAALLVLALGLLLMWIFIWFIGGPIVGLVRSAIALARKWCYKEVPAV